MLYSFFYQADISAPLQRRHYHDVQSSIPLGLPAILGLIELRLHTGQPQQEHLGSQAIDD